MHSLDTRVFTPVCIPVFTALKPQLTQDPLRSIGSLTVCRLEVAGDRLLRDLRQLPRLPSRLSTLETLTEVVKSIKH